MGKHAQNLCHSDKKAKITNAVKDVEERKHSYTIRIGISKWVLSTGYSFKN